MRKIAVCLSKGGVGKTTTATTVCVGLARKGRKVLLVDCDTQGQASFFLGLRPEEGLAELLLRERTFEQVLVQARDNLWVLAGGRRLADAQLSVSKRLIAVEKAIIEALAPAEGAFDYVVLDMAPGWDVLSVNALMYADEILAPVELQMPAIESLAQFEDRLTDIRVYKPGLSITYLLPTMWDRRSSESLAILEQLKTYYPTTLCAPIRASVRFFEATRQGLTVLEYPQATTGLEDYSALIANIEEASHGNKTS